MFHHHQKLFYLFRKLYFFYIEYELNIYWRIEESAEADKEKFEINAIAQIRAIDAGMC